MKILTNILYIGSILIGVMFAFFGGVAGADGIGAAISGGVFIALGITIFILNRN